MKLQQQQKPPRRLSQAKYHRWEFLIFDFKEMITEVLLVLPDTILYGGDFNL